MKEEKQKNKEKYKKLINEAIEDLKTPGKRHKQIPNVLTTLRLLAPVAIIPAAASGNLPLTISLVAGFSLTDFVDGFIARNWNLTSELGKDLDAVTDKVFAATLLISASLSNPILLANLGLEGVIAGINVNQKLKGMDTSSSYVGKIKTWLLFTLAGLGIVTSQLTIPGLIPTLAIGTAAMQGLTIASYLSKYNKTSSNTPKEISETKNIELNDEEQASSVFDKTKTKEYTSPTIEEKNKKEYSFEDYKEMSNFLHQEQQNQLSHKEEPKVYAKKDNNNQ